MSRIKTIFFILLFIFIATKIQNFFLFSAKISNYLTPPIAIGYKSCSGNFSQPILSVSKASVPSVRCMIDIIQHAYSFLLKNSLNIWKLLNFRVSLQKNKTYQDKEIKTYPCKGIKKFCLSQVFSRILPTIRRENE